MIDSTTAASPGSPGAQPWRQATVGRLRSLLIDQNEPVLLLGAGCSIRSGIPDAARTVEQAAKWAWCKEHGRHVDDSSVRRSDYWPWLNAQPWFRPDVSLANLYPTAIDNLLGVKRDRREFFEQLIHPLVPPSTGYTALAEILHRGWISTVLTTNFDQCLEKAATQHTRPHRLVSIRTPADYVMFNSAPHDPQLVFLHGSVQHYTDKNLVDEVQTLDPHLVDPLRAMLRDHPVIVVGYRGNEASVMRDLFLAQARSSNLLQGVYWCVRERDQVASLAPLVEELARTIHSNFQLVPIQGFDELLDRDLLQSLTTSNTPPMRRRAGPSVGRVPTDMKSLAGFDSNALERPLLAARLQQYAERTSLWHPVGLDSDWLDQTAELLTLVRVNEGVRTPTLAGWLLFSRNPSEAFPQARVEFEATGPAYWLRSRFGSDIDLEESSTPEVSTVRRTIGGNLWNQLDDLIELLSLVNFQFRLKGEVSRTVSAYNAIAIKEMIVNAIVHRDYDRTEPVLVAATTNSITVTSPGGLVDDIVIQMGSQSLQDAIAERSRLIKGYRNPAISDLFYGGGQMDRRGSGLSDMLLATVNNNGLLTFGPTTDNRSFVVSMQARPESIDEITNTAMPLVEGTVRYSTNLIPIISMPTTVWHAGTTAKRNADFYKSATGLAVPRGWVSDGRFYSLYDLEALATASLTPFDQGDIETLGFDELRALPGGEAICLKLMHDLVFEHLRAKGLQIELDRRRAYFGRGEEPELKVSYQARVRKATRTVVKARMKRDSGQVAYYEHKAFSFSLMTFGSEWAMVLAPGYAFTRDGVRLPIGRDRTNSLSTRRAARDFNSSVQQDVAFWVAVISGEAEGLFALEHRVDSEVARFAPVVLLGPKPPTISFSAAAFDDGPHADADSEAELQALDEELERLALEADAALEDDHADLVDRRDGD